MYSHRNTAAPHRAQHSRTFTLCRAHACSLARAEAFPLQVVLTGIPVRHGPPVAFGLCGDTVFLAPRHSAAASRQLLVWNLGGSGGGGGGASLVVHLWGHGDLTVQPQHRPSGLLREAVGTGGIVPCYNYDAVRAAVLAAGADLRSAPALLAVGAHPGTRELVLLDTRLEVHALRLAGGGALRPASVCHLAAGGHGADAITGHAAILVHHHFGTPGRRATPPLPGAPPGASLHPIPPAARPAAGNLPPRYSPPVFTPVPPPPPASQNHAVCVSHAAATDVFSLITGAPVASMACAGPEPHRPFASHDGATATLAGIWAAGGGGWQLRVAGVTEQVSRLTAGQDNVRCSLPWRLPSAAGY